MRKLSVTTTVVAAFLMGSLISIPLTAVGSPQTQVSSFLAKNVEKMDWEQRDIRDGLRELFRDSKVSYAIAPEVQGSVTLSLRNVTMETALQNALRQVDATYRIEHDVIIIRPRNQEFTQAQTRLQTAADPYPGRIIESPSRFGPPLVPIIEQDGHYLYILRGNSLLKVAKKDLKVERSTMLPMP